MIVAANLKTNLTRTETAEYLNELESFLVANAISQDVFVFPATSSLDTHKGQVTVGAQNSYPAKSGAFTGEIGLEHLEEFGIQTILIGHSERRHILGETQAFIAQKFNYFKELGFKIVYCVGEPLEVREAGEDVMMQYLEVQYEGIDTNYENLIIAYEPVWAIGTGLTPTMEEISSLHMRLKEKSEKPLLYGGSVKVENAKDVFALDGVDGVLVGSAALKVDDFCKMISFAQEINK
ncbi:MAG: triose-phosphate isomerase [Epsilonproteobacteria bacterium]|nr:triose-phosphate isomerase [Campylobacterota bacterium]OIO14123.1 MAG: triose-phosphate isomerase [Helicobacteraceae bacterium CG1_02_36_14]PIP09694.1 MAG: triose-phosphate isomerase [Sulfurimonas sp. CG23_combo_of_CG06-09_8_20_14_all_36_33]PIS26239.1 MAG: triose-phosphate isomerase [Sulfurimonas sp. CG08_land_8_20_14_0_20_36_33]PIU34323.1 MAG: triose-phosphate isomerase [Sulfurimonas sp. CG07_land_8_20_14_0_80_36_56]PIV02621.1 MAG: triose-phosphate isomerase [Sulfurimonas sp. CG03_land_8_2